MRILLADDHILVREAIALVFKRYEPACEVIETSNCRETFDKIHEQPCIDLIVFDYIMPDSTGIATVKALRNLAPDVPIIVLSSTEDRNIIQQALAIGINGYITKTTSSEVMINAIRLVMSGGVYLPEALLTSDHVRENQQVRNDGRPLELDKLTKRQKQILSVLRLGLSNKEIAKQMSLSESTVRFHLCAIFKILNVKSRAHVIHLLSTNDTFG
jgi:DNA-binding NarL/FixJ family response regulator